MHGFIQIKKQVLFSSTHLDESSLDLQREEFEKRESGKVRKYSWDYDKNYDIFSKNLLSGKIERLTNSVGYDAEASYSPDGQKILFSSNRHVYNSHLSLGLQKELETNPSSFNELYIMDSSGENIQRLTTVKGYDGGPFFNSDGDEICWRRFSPSGHTAEIFSMNLNRLKPRQLTKLDSMSWAPFFHPSNQYLIFSTNIHGFENFELYIVDKDGKKDPIRVTERDGFDGLPTFSPDGRTISWTSNKTPSGNSQIFTATWNHDLALSKLGILNKHKNPKISHSFSDHSNDITESDTKQLIEYLASENLAGRATGSEGMKVASKFVSECFKNAGLQPFEEDNWFQTFTFVKTVEIAKSSSMKILLKDEENINLNMQNQWNPLPFSEDGKINAELLYFAGYGIRTNPKIDSFDYDSYAHLDVKGKWVVVLDGMPGYWKEEIKSKLRYKSTLLRKSTTARDLGAKGIIIIQSEKGSLKNYSFANSMANNAISLAAFQLNFETADKIFKINERSLAETITNLNASDGMMGFQLKNALLTGSINVLKEKSPGRNTLGWLRASNKSNSEKFIVIGAHLDHIGRGRRSSRAKKSQAGMIHPGADDNASGIAALIEIAQFLADLKRKGILKFKHDILFAAWSGEEIGLIGSNHFVKEVFDQNIISYLNMDMIGRMNKQMTLHGIGSSSAWRRIVQKANVPVGLNLNLQEDSHIPTDTTSFISRNVPIISAFSGLHEDYHSPTDTADKINHTGVSKCAKLFARILISISNEDPIDFVPQSPPKQSVSKLKAYLGTIPNYSQTDRKGVLLNGVAKGGPADLAGLKEDDLIVELNGKLIENIYDYTDAISTLTPNLASKISIVRKGKKIKSTITPKGR